MNKNIFHQQADLMLSILPFMTKETGFALHGGTAINFFLRDMPRLSVDIDLTWLTVESRDEAMNAMSEALMRTAKQIKVSVPAVQVEEKREAPNKPVTKLFIRRQNAHVKVEPNQVIRGTLFPPEQRELCQRAQETFEKFVMVNTLSTADLFGSKLCAALDRQHPRDLFDVMLLLKHGGITEEIRKAFLVYLISHNRPIAEVLSPNLKDMKPVFEAEFAGMALFEVSYEELVQSREMMIAEIKRQLTQDEKAFLLSFKRRQPEWKFLGISGAEKLPAVQWKLRNLEKMDKAKHQRAVEALEQVLS